MTDYKCKCGSTLITEIWSGDVITKYRWEDGKLVSYHETSDNGHSDYYQCTECGEIIQDDEWIREVIYNGDDTVVVPPSPSSGDDKY